MSQCTVTGCNEIKAMCVICHTKDNLYCSAHTQNMKQVEHVQICNGCIDKSTCPVCEKYTKRNVKCSFCHIMADKCKEHSNYTDYVGSMVNTICCPTCATSYTCPKCQNVGRETRTCYHCGSQMCFKCHDPSKWKVIQIGGGARHKVRHGSRTISKVIHICTTCQPDINMGKIYTEFPCVYCEALSQSYV